jgi:hypothetical protein
MKKMLGNQGACVCYVKGCGTKLYTGSFAEQVFEDTGVQTEVTVRRKILAEYVIYTACVPRTGWFLWKGLGWAWREREPARHAGVVCRR